MKIQCHRSRKLCFISGLFFACSKTHINCGVSCQGYEIYSIHYFSVVKDEGFSSTNLTNLTNLSGLSHLLFVRKKGKNIDL